LKGPDDTLDTSDGVTMQRLNEWTAFLYQQHLRRMGGLPRIDEQERIKRGVRALAVRVIKDEPAAWSEVLRLYGRLRQGPPASRDVDRPRWL
jgi:hypothetical protein